MKKWKLSLLIIFTTLIIIFGSWFIYKNYFDVSYVESNSPELPEIPEEPDKPEKIIPFGYYQLTEEQQKIYDIMETRKFKLGDIYYFDKEIDFQTVNIVQDLYNQNNFELCNDFCYGTMTVHGMGDEKYPAIGIIASDIPHQYSDFSLLIKKADEKADEIINSIPTNLNDFEKIKYIHDYLLRIISYDNDYISGEIYPDDSFHKYVSTTYGALIYGKAICGGYANAFQYVGRKAGFNVISIYSTNHVWNLVQIKGNWYHIDLTWDDDESYIRYDYFLRSDAEMKSKNREWKEFYSKDIKIPSCTTELELANRIQLEKINLI